MPALSSPEAAACVAPRASREELAQACSALWLATLSLMTAFMQTRAPAHRLLLARRITRNFQTLQRQDCFSTDCRERFARLALRWDGQARDCGPEQDQPQGGGRGMLAALWQAARGAF